MKESLNKNKKEVDKTSDFDDMSNKEFENPFKEK